MNNSTSENTTLQNLLSDMDPESAAALNQEAHRHHQNH
jgi:hypothetical protein